MREQWSMSRRGFVRGAAAVAASAPFGAKAAPGIDDMLLLSDVRVSMRDGITLATDIYLPAHSGKPVRGRYPVLMERTPYGRNLALHRDFTATNRTPLSRAEVASRFVKHGYVVIFQDVRGRYDSDGDFVKYLADANDGLDMCNWIVRQDWCNGSIGTMGLSYAAHTQMALACLNPPGLKAMYVDCGGFSNAFRGGIRQGGAFELKQVTWAYNFGLKSPAVEADPLKLAQLKAIDLKAWFASMPWKRGHSPLSPIPEYEDYVFEQWERGNFDDFWKQPGIYAEGYYDNFPNAAMVHMSGWYDPYSQTATNNFVGLDKRGKAPVRLIMGPWTHGARSTSYAGDIDFGPESTLDHDVGKDFFEYRREFFDEHLKGITPARKPSKVRLFVMGGGTGKKTKEGRLLHGGAWRSEPEWPLPSARPTKFYFHEQGRLSRQPPKVGAESLTYTYDPQNPVLTIGGPVTSGNPLFWPGGFDQREGSAVYGSKEPWLPLSARPDVLTFQTEPLDSDIEVTGPIEARLWISSDCVDTDFTVKLLDIYPPSEDYPEGFDLNITDGILRCRYRDSWEKPSLMTPGSVYPISIEVFPTSNLFKKGHRIRVDVSSSNFPRFDINPNTGAPEGKALALKIASNTVFLDPDRPSHIVLPVVSAAR